MSGGSISGSPTPTPAEAAGVRSEGPSSRSEAPQEDAESQRPRTNTRALQHKGPFIRWKLSPGADSRQRKPSPLRIATVTHQRLPAGRQTNKQRAAEERIISTPHRSERMFIGGGFVFGVTAATLRASHCSHYGGRSMLIRQLIVFGQ